MRKLFLILIFSLSIHYISAQEPGYITYSSSVKLIALQGSESYEWENTDSSVVLNYKTGDFIARLKNSDFYNPLHPEPSDPDIEQEEREFLFKGIFPINDLINQKSTSQHYNVELQLICDDLRLNEPVNFEMTVTNPNPGSSQKSYRIFSMQGILYNDQLNLQAFDGFDNEIELYDQLQWFF